MAVLPRASTTITTRTAAREVPRAHTDPRPWAATAAEEVEGAAAARPRREGVGTAAVVEEGAGEAVVAVGISGIDRGRTRGRAAGVQDAACRGRVTAGRRRGRRRGGEGAGVVVVVGEMEVEVEEGGMEGGGRVRGAVEGAAAGDAVPAMIRTTVRERGVGVAAHGGRRCAYLGT